MAKNTFQQNMEGAWKVNPNRSAKLFLSAPLENYIAFFERLNARSTFLLSKLVEDKIQFSDPYYEAVGQGAMEKILLARLKKHRSLKYKLVDYGWSKDGYRAYLSWKVQVLRKSGAQEEFDAMSEIQFSSRGRVMAHQDVWDTGAEYYDSLTLWDKIVNVFRKKENPLA